MPLRLSIAGVAQLIERRLAKAKVAGLSPVSRSKKFIKSKNLSHFKIQFCWDPLSRIKAVMDT